MPGTTRDAIDTIVETEDGPLRFVDTAGMRRRSQIDEPTEYFSLVRALQAVDRADAALLVIDAHRGRDATRTSASPSGSTPPAPPSSSSSTSGTCSTPKGAGQAQDRRRRPARRSSPTRRCSPSPRSPGRMMQRMLPALRQAEEAYHTAGPDRGAQPGDPRRPAGAPAAGRRASTGPGSSTPPRARPTRRRSRSSPPTSCRRRTCATWSARSARRSTSAPPRSSSACAAATADVLLPAPFSDFLDQGNTGDGRHLRQRLRQAKDEHSRS